jgi:hypothetical protein
MVRRNRLTKSIAPIFIATFGAQAAAQTSDGATAEDDWSVVRNGDVVAAYLRYESGLNIVVRCANDRMEAWIGGLPAATEELRTRPVATGLNRATGQAQEWYIGRDRTTIVSTSPARFARWLREGGALNVSLPGAGEGGRNIRYVADLPASHAVLDETLTACGKPLTDARDDEIDRQSVLPIRWAERPAPRYPTRRMYEWGFASVSCLTTPTGRLERCEVESEYPEWGGFGGAALASLDEARLETDGEAVPRRVVQFVVRFQMGGESSGANAYFAPATRLREP